MECEVLTRTRNTGREFALCRSSRLWPSARGRAEGDRAAICGAMEDDEFTVQGSQGSQKLRGDIKGRRIQGKNGFNRCSSRGKARLRCGSSTGTQILGREPQMFLRNFAYI